jgi:hypothetical protein
METLESLSALCSENNRAVPNPDSWNQLYGMLKNKRQNSSGVWEPPLPLILGAWWHSMPIEKVMRFQEHLKWAEKEGQLEEVGGYLRSLREDEWAHSDELTT